MTKLLKYSLLMALWFIALLGTAQTPIEVTKKVADRVLKNTPFAYRLTLPKTTDEFNFIRKVDFRRTFGLGKSASAYAYTHILSESDQLVEFDLSHNDYLKIWCNDEMVYEKKGKSKSEIQARERDVTMTYTFKAKLKKGINRILILSGTYGDDWMVLLQPKGATVEFSEIKGLKLGLQTVIGVTPEVAKLADWLVLGPYKFEDVPKAPEFKGSPIIGKVYNNQTWSIPRIEVFGDFINAEPMWGTYYSWNYHAAGVAWALSQLSEYSGDKKYDEFSQRYCDFILESKPFVDFQVNHLYGFHTAQHHMFNTPLLDFTAAPSLPFVYRLGHKKPFKYETEAKELIAQIQTYLEKDQVKLEDGTFTRETPFKYTTWVDDMFMGIPFLVHSASFAPDAATADKYIDQAAKQVIGFNKVVWDANANLYMHAQYSFKRTPLPHWSRANGWGIFATSEVLLKLPKKHKLYKPILEHYKKHVDALIALQAADGFWHNVLDHPETYKETSGTAIFTLAIARGVNNGWLPAKYAESAKKGWEAVKTAIKADGTVTQICIGTMSSEDVKYYASRPTADNDSHGLIGVLMAGMEMDKLVKSGK